ncbi:MAG TPA: M28 family peptidase [Pyrinomonadaceae bacterium]|nr:M28 family peptidase [Pyrinomonadaceae bacterium]
MKQNILLVFLFLMVPTVGFGQTIPASKVIDSKQLLADVKILSADDMQGRLTGSEGGAKAREYVLQRFKQSGIKPFADNYLQLFEFSSRPTQKVKGINVVGFIKGKKNPEKYIVITAHYDHVGINKGNVFNGADDNASGTAALFAMAKYFSKNQPANSLIFVAFDAEEMGLQGSKYFVANLPVKKETILINLNMDMISHNDKNELYATGTFQNPGLKPMLEKVQKKSLIKLLLGHDDPKLGSEDWTFQSDQGSFYKEKIPFIYFGVEDHKDYHQPTDDFETINQPFYIHAVETILEAVKEFDKNSAEIGNQKK